MRFTLFSKIGPFFMIPLFVFGDVFSVLAVTLNDPFLADQWYLNTIHAPKAWQQTTGSSELIVAVLDAGFDLDHPDLAGQFWKNPDEIPGNKKDDDRNGFEDDVVGWDFVDSDPDPSPFTSPLATTENTFNDTVISHGTMIAGIIGAIANNNEGIVGINHHVSIMPLRILNEQGLGSSIDVRQAIIYAVQNGAQVINLSFTSDKVDERLLQTIEWAFDQGVVIVSAVGNGGHDLNIKPTYPACFDQLTGREMILGVAATDRNDKKATFSNFGSKCTDVSAPGTNIFGTVYHDPSHLFTSTAYSSPWEGTSIAAPMVSATAALLKGFYPLLTPEQIMLAIKLSVDPVKESSVIAREQLGSGRLNVLGALNAAKVFARAGSGSHSKLTSHSKSFVVAEGRGSEPIVRRVNAKGEVLAEFFAYNRNFRGGISVAVGDVNGDGKEEIVTGAKSGGGPQVRVFDLDGNVLSQFFADDPSDRHGILVAVADTNGDGTSELYITPERTGTGEVKVFNQYGQLQGLIRPFGRQTGLIRLAFGNMDEDPEVELITTWSENPQAAVRVLDGNGRYVREFSISKSMAQASLSSGDINGDGLDEILLSSARGSSPNTEIYSSLGNKERFFSSFSPFMRAGVQTCVGDIDQNGRAEVYAVPLFGGGPQVQIFDVSGVLIGSFFTFDSNHRFGMSCAM